MTQLAKTSAAKQSNLSLMPGSHTQEIMDSHALSYDLHAFSVAWVHIHTFIGGGDISHSDLPEGQISLTIVVALEIPTKRIRDDKMKFWDTWGSKEEGM